MLAIQSRSVKVQPSPTPEILLHPHRAVAVERKLARVLARQCHVRGHANEPAVRYLIRIRDTPRYPATPVAFREPSRKRPKFCPRPPAPVRGGYGVGGICAYQRQPAIPTKEPRVVSEAT